MNNLKLTEAQLSDYDCFYGIRSEETNLFWTGYENAPDYENFKKWFETRLNDTARNIYILRENDECLGALNIDVYSDHLFIGYSIKSKAQGMGLASFMVSQVEELATITPEIKEIRAWINFQNIASIKVCEKNGYIKSQTTETRKRFGKEELYYLLVKNL